jgi:alpha-1,2-mannosyltransferase
MTTWRGQPSMLVRTALPIIAIAAFALTASVIAVAAGSLLGYDFQAYVSAAHRLLDGERLYDPAVSVAGGFAIYLYPPPYAIAFVPFALIPNGVGVVIWTVLLGVAFVAGAALLPVRREVRWAIVLLAALDWPVLYSIKLGQVGPILFLLFAIGWRAMDRPAWLAGSIVAGTVTKLQPAALAGWALLTGRVRAAVLAIAGVVALAAISTLFVGVGAWADYVSLLVRVSSPITTPHNFTPGAIAFQAGASEGVAAAIQLATTALAVAASLVAIRYSTAAASFVVVVVATQLVSPLLWDHYAIILLIPVAYLIDRGHWWAAAIPLVTSLPLLGLVPAAAYPVEFLVCLLAPIAVGWSGAPARSPLRLAQGRPG